MKLLRVLLLASLAAPAAAQPNEFPTSGRVEYVLECMQKHDGKYEFLYKCSCVIDRIAEAMPYEDFVAMSTALRDQALAGERGGVFRDAPTVKVMADKYRTIQANANKACHVQQR
ncbi:hypothetical protein AB4Z32_27030 [Massilia sp. 2TAF26]|uniref:hypothetical protein n=1 Tax=Massilia sp. 2TAF26 TaxID=3233012 RepID=UPI003F9CAA4E